ncbi:MAG: hypothetical protein WDM79_02555 [Terricaulis sp.]
MKRFVRGAIAVVCLVVVSACASLVTGGPLIRPGEPVGAIEVINRSARLVDVVLISDCSASTYGLNRLPDGRRDSAGPFVPVSSVGGAAGMSTQA